MERVVWFALGVAAAYVAFRPTESACCKRVAANVRLRAAEELGQGVATVGDVFGLWDRSPALLDLVGVPLDA